jgi:hypothetical protein
MDINFVLALCTALVGATAYIVTTAVFVGTTRADIKELKTRFRDFQDSVEKRLNRLEIDVTEIKAICRERSRADTPA